MSNQLKMATVDTILTLRGLGKTKGVRYEWHCRRQLLYGYGVRFCRVPLVIARGAARMRG